MKEVMLQEDAAAIFAMLFGGYGELQLELLDVFTADGIVHILSVFGSPIILIAAVMAWLKDWHWGGICLGWSCLCSWAVVILPTQEK